MYWLFRPFIVKPQFPLSFLFLCAKAQERTLIGKVVDENNEGLPGVNIIIKGTTIGTITDFEGVYKLNIPEETNMIVFSAIGYNTQESERTTFHCCISKMPHKTIIIHDNEM